MNVQDEPLVSQLYSDRPIESAESDLLGRGIFCIRLADAIRNWSNADSLAIAIYGAWGEGKSSAKNIVLSLLRRADNAPVIVEFNPWWWSGQNAIAEAFFREIGAALQQGDAAHDARILAQRWRLYSQSLSLGGTALGQLGRAADAMGMPEAAAMLQGTGIATATIGDVAGRAADVHSALAAVEARTTAELKTDLASRLASRDAPLLIVIDDIDRLAASEIRLLFRLIKANADFPNVVYLLLFDRQIVEDALNEDSSGRGRDYLEKIVQAGLNLPRTDQHVLKSLLNAELERLFAPTQKQSPIDNQRWQELHHSVVSEFVRSLRDVRRFLSTLSFHLGMFRKGSFLEANPIDIIALELLRVFEPDVHQRLPLLKHDLLETGGSSNDIEELRRRRERLESLLAKASDPIATRNALEILFPQVEWALDNRRGHAIGGGWVRELRVCHEDVFDRYFAFDIADEDVKQSAIASAIEAAQSVSAFENMARELLVSGTFRPVISRLEAHAEVMALPAVESAMTALLNLGDQMSSRAAGFAFGELQTATSFLNSCLSRRYDTDGRGEALLRVIKASNGHRLQGEILVWNMPDADRSRVGSISHEYLLQCRDICRERIATAARNDSILEGDLGSSLRKWHLFGGTAELRDWFNERTSTPEQAFDLTRRLVQRAWFHHMVNTPSNAFLNLHELGELIDTSRLRETLSPYLSDKISQEYAKTVADFPDEHTAIRAAFAEF